MLQSVKNANLFGGLLGAVAPKQPKIGGLLGFDPSAPPDLGANPIARAAVAYGLIGQGNDPLGAGISALISGRQDQKQRLQEYQLKQAQAEQQNNILNQFKNGGSPTPQSIAQAVMMELPGADKLLEITKYNQEGTKQDAGSYYKNPFGQMTYLPKLGEGMVMANDGSVAYAPGYANSQAGLTGMQESAKQWAGVAPAIAQHQANAGVDYQYDLGKQQAANQYDWNKMQAGNQFELDKMGAKQQFDVNNYAYQDQLKARGDMTQVYNPQTGAMEYVPRSAVMQGGYMASKPDAAKQADQWNEGQTKSAQEYVKSMRDQSTNNASLGQKLNSLSELSNKIAEGKVGAFRSYIGSFAPNLGIDPTINDKQQFEAIINGLIPTLKVPGSGTFTDKDAEIMAKSLPQLSGTAEGRAKILSDLKDKVAMQNAENDAMESYIQRYGKLDDRYYQLRNDFYKAWGG